VVFAPPQPDKMTVIPRNAASGRARQEKMVYFMAGSGDFIITRQDAVSDAPVN
jgi:hypothetical protein